MLPTVHVAMDVPEASPFLELSVQSLLALDYPKHLMSLHFLLHGGSVGAKHRQVIETTLAAAGDAVGQYSNVSYEEQGQAELYSFRARGIHAAQDHDSDYYLHVSALVRLTNKDSLKHLIAQNRPVITPAVTRPEKWFSNFWFASEGDVGQDNFCEDEHDMWVGWVICKATRSCDQRKHSFIPRLHRCEEWARKGECESNPVWMKNNCQLSCGACSAHKATPGYKRGYAYLDAVNRTFVWGLGRRLFANLHSPNSCKCTRICMQAQGRVGGADCL